MTDSGEVSLRRLSADIVTATLDLLDLDNVLCLWLTGSKYVQQLLSTRLRHLSKDKSSLTRSSSAFRILPSLQGLERLAFAVKGDQALLTPFEDLKRISLPQLKSLELRVDDGLQLLTFDAQNGSFLHASALKASFPALTVLKVTTNELCDSAQAFTTLALLPLTKLNIDLGAVSLEAIALLPQLLLSLRVAIAKTSTPDGWDCLKLPPALTSLSVLTMSAYERALIPRLPRTLISLKFNGVYRFPDEEIWSEDETLEMVKLLPPNLTVLDICSGTLVRSSFSFSEQSFKLLPQSLTDMRIKVWKFPLEEFKRLPPRLVTFNISADNCAGFGDWSVAHWPRSITNSDRGTWDSETWQYLPAGFRGSQFVRTDEHLPHASHLPLNTEYLSINASLYNRFLASASCLNLAHLSLHKSTAETFRLISRFPLLSNLQITSDSFENFLLLKLDHLTSLFLCTQTPAKDLDLSQPWASRLKTLIISDSSNNVLAVSDDWVLRLPRSLTEIVTKAVDVSIPALSLLPPGLLHMHLSVSTMDTVETYAKMPRSLRQIRLFRSAPSINGSIARLAAALPLYISALALKAKIGLVLDDPPHESTKQLLEPLLRARPCLETFDFPGTHPATEGKPLRLRHTVEANRA